METVTGGAQHPSRSGGGFHGKVGGRGGVRGNEEGVGNRPRKLIDKGQLITETTCTRN